LLPRHLCRLYENVDRFASNFYALFHYIAEPRRVQMDKQTSTPASVLASAAAGAWTSLVNSLRRLIAIDVRTYRPERYYMRGPGPKWRAKHAHERVHTSSFLR
jgi:hypothetical protein